MINQGQHRISQIYLKQFGFRDKNKHWRISVYEKDSSLIVYKFIKSFTKESNIFDVTLFDEEVPEIRRQFENNSKLLEDFYASVIRKIEKNNEIDDLSRSILFQFVANTLCRTERFRSMLELFLHPLTREKFFTEITMFSKHKDSITLLKSISPSLPINEQINIIIGSVMNHLIKVFETFNMVVVKDFGKRRWLTSDNPVTLDVGEERDWFTLKAEVYFPLSPNYCLFMYCPSVKGDNELRNIEHGQVIQATQEMHDKLTGKIISNANKYLIFSLDMGRLNLKNK